MASIRYRQRGLQKLWSYEIRDKGAIVAHKSGFKKKKDAIFEAERVAHKIRQGGQLSGKMTLVELYEEWLELKILPSDRSDSTKQKYINRKKKIIEYFGDKPISEIRPSEYQRILNRYGQKVSKGSLRRLHHSIRQAVMMAISDKLVIDDFTYNADFYSSKQGTDDDDKYLHSEEDYWAVIHYFEEKMDYKQSVVPYIIYFLFKTGMRFGELVGLTWDDVDYEGRQLYTYRRYNTALQKFVPPKNKTSIRYVPISHMDLVVLRKLYQEQNLANLELGIDNPDKLIFQHFGYKGLIPIAETVNKALRAGLKELDIEPAITSKGARHTYGSYLWHKRLDLGVIAKILGHKDISMLIEVYGHTLEEKINHEYDLVRELVRNK